MNAERTNIAPQEAEISTAEASNITLYQKVREKFGDLLNSPLSRRVALATSAVVLPVVAAACGGGSAKSEKTVDVAQTQTAVPTIGSEVLGGEHITPIPTPKAEAPTVAPTATAEAVQKKLSEAKFKPTTFDELVKAVDLAYEKHPDIADVEFLFAPGKTRKDLQITLDLCRDKLGPEKMGPCAALVSIMYNAYDKTGYQESYDAAVQAADYILTVLPGSGERLASFLQPQINQEPPSVN